MTFIILVIQESDAGGALKFRSSQPGLYRTFQVSQDYIVRYCLQNKTKNAIQMTGIAMCWSTA